MCVKCNQHNQNCQCNTELSQVLVNGNTSNASIVDFVWTSLNETLISDWCNLKLELRIPWLLYNSTTMSLSIEDTDWVVNVLDLSSLWVDVYVDDGSFNTTTNILTLTDTDWATPDIAIDLSSLSTQISTDALGNITITSNGNTVTIPAPVSWSTLSITDLTDVDTSTITPNNGDILVFNTATWNWEPVSTTSDYTPYPHAFMFPL